MRSDLGKAYLEPFEKYASARHLQDGLAAARQLMWIHVGNSLMDYAEFVCAEMPSGLKVISRVLRRFIDEFLPGSYNF